ncbi:OsmC family protein [Isoptericola sp. NPDC019693]|uniref:OsmC family protein n=1 Tax=Isoptericola sp. NPDC019693 TaxID=3364009 RepID=UPI0037B5677A
MGAHHNYAVTVAWPDAAGAAAGSEAPGTTSYTSYSRNHTVAVTGKPPLLGSADPAFRGDPARHNPEELFVASLAQCHMLWFLHLAAEHGLVVREYTDETTGTMRVESRGEGQFTDVTLRPRVTVDAGPEATDEAVAELHRRAHALCFIARSVNFSVLVEPAPVRLATPAT